MKIKNNGTSSLKIRVAGTGYTIRADEVATIPDAYNQEVYSSVLPNYPDLSVTDPISGDDSADADVTSYLTTAQDDIEDLGNSVAALVPKGGTTTARLAIATPVDYSTFFDTTLGKPCFYSGSSWVLADGTEADA